MKEEHSYSCFPLKPKFPPLSGKHFLFNNVHISQCPTKYDGRKWRKDEFL